MCAYLSPRQEAYKIINDIEKERVSQDAFFFVAQKNIDGRIM